MSLKQRFIPVFLFLILLSVFARRLETASIDPQFRQYWYQGKAELTRYSLEQARYGQIHKGEAVLIFVTEPFLKDKQVKLESANRGNAVSVLKANLTRKFYTGVYPYSVMTSVFSPVDFEKNRTLKVSSSSQEWCGHTYMQLNLRGDHYDATLHSYFEKEADQNVQLKTEWLEDEVWTRMRVAPDTLPKGDLRIIPALHHARLLHIPLKAERATATLSPSKKAGSSVYTIDYQDIRRKLSIEYENQFPYTILKWEETQPGGFGDSQLLTTRAVKTNSILLDYWNKNQVEDAGYRKKLGLTE